MAQHDYNLANQSGADFRADLNNALSAIATTNSGATSPSTTFAHQLWVDTANSVLKIRNSANDAWITTGVSITADNTFDINGGTVNGITSFSFSTGSTVTSILDEDDLSSDSATALATQQSIKAYVDSQVATVDTLAEILLNGNSTGGTDISLSSSDITGTGNINITGTIQSSGTITGNLTGDVTGNASTATALETARTINGASFDGTANISFDTDSVSEGSSNLYFTNARVESYLDAGTSTPTFASAVINSSITGSAVLDDDTFGTASATTVATSESIKAYVDSQVGSVDTLAEILLNGNTTGGTDISLSSSDITGTGNINITGTVTSDGLTVEGLSNATATTAFSTTANFPNASLIIANSAATTGNGNYKGALGFAKGGTSPQIRSAIVGKQTATSNNVQGLAFLVHPNSVAGSLTEALLIKANNDIAFYDNTGTSENMVWDASADSLNFVDNAKAIFGTGSDLEIYHDGIDSYIDDAGTGDLRIRSNFLKIEKYTGETMATFNDDNAVTLYFNNAAKLATTSQGISVTGLIQAETIQLNASGSTNPQIQLNNNDFGTFDWLLNQADSGKYVVTVSGTGGPEMELESDGSDYTNAVLNVGGQRVLTQTAGINLNGDLGFNDGYKAIFGTGSDLQIYHDGSNSIITDAGAGNLELKATNLVFKNAAGTLQYASFISGGAAELRYNGSPKLATTSTGIDVTGEVQADTHFTSSDLVATLSTTGSGGSVYLRPNGQTQSSGQAVLDTSGNLDVSGTVTSDGLTVDNGLIYSNSTTPDIRLMESDATDQNTQIRNNAGDLQIRTLNDAQSSATLRFNLDHATGDISFYDDTGSTQGFFWDASAESLGIGTSSPNAKLTVQNGIQRINSTDGSSDARIQFSMTDGSNVPTAWVGIPNWNKDALYIYGPTAAGNEVAALYTEARWQFYTGGFERARIDSSGKVGIKNTSPSSQFFNTLVVGNTSGDNGITIQSSATGKGVLAFSDTDAATSGRYDGYINYNHTSQYMSFHTNTGNERARINSSGKLGVNTTELDGILTLKQLANSDSNGLDGIRIHASTGDTYAGFGLANATGTLAITAGDAGGTEDTEIVFRTASSGSEAEKARITSAGELQLTGNGVLRNQESGGNFSYLQQTSSDARLYVQYSQPLLFGTNNTERVRIDSSGNLIVAGTSVGASNSFGIDSSGIATISRASGVGRNMILFKNGGSDVGSITTNSSSTAYNTTSDARLKDVTGEARGLEVITKLNPVAYNWKADGKADEGLIAQEVKEIVPNAVSGSEDEHYQMDYSKLVTPLVKAVQELEQQVTKLKSEIAKLKGE